MSELLRTAELSDADALLVLHCLVHLDYVDHQLLEKVVKRLETATFSMTEPASHALLEQFPGQPNFRGLMEGLPVSHKVRIMLRDLPDGPPGKPPKTKKEWRQDPFVRWQKLDPIDMEEWEKTQYNEGAQKVLRTRHIEATPRPMRTGNKLAAQIGFELLQTVPTADLETLAQIAAPWGYLGRVLHGDLNVQAQEALAKRLLSFEPETYTIYIYIYPQFLVRLAGDAPS